MASPLGSFGRTAVAALAWVAATSVTPTTAGGCYAPASGFEAQQGNWHCKELSPTLALHYKVDVEEDSLYLGVHAKNHDGWIGIGVNGNGGMKGASMVIVRKLNQSFWFAEDRHALSFAMPVLDEQQDATLLDAGASDGDITWTVTLPLSSCDPHDYKIKDIAHMVLWAKGSSHTFEQHGGRIGVDRGNTEVNFYRPADEVHNDPVDAFTIDLAMPNVPAETAEGPAENAWVCAAFDLSQLGITEGAYHITRYGPIISEASAKYVHHMLMAPCFGTEMPGFVNTSTDMSEWVMMDCTAMTACPSASFAWAVGTGDLAFPPHTGLPVDTSTRYFVLQVHYTNPSVDHGVRDSSGFRLTVTKTLRPVHIGPFAFQGGSHPWQQVPLPPGQQGVMRVMQVPSACFDPVFDVGFQELSVFRVVHHAHASGREIQLHVIRDGIDIGLLRTEKVYDFLYQSLAEPEVATLRPGDQILMTCKYDTTQAAGPTVFGQGATDEMCTAAMYYYPGVGRLGAQVVPPDPSTGAYRTACYNGTVVSTSPFDYQHMPEQCSNVSSQPYLRITVDAMASYADRPAKLARQWAICFAAAAAYYLLQT